MIIPELLRQGYTPEGAPRNYIDEGGAVRQMGEGALGKIMAGLGTYIRQQEKAQRKQQEEFVNRFSAYKTLRSAGYSIEDAYKHAGVKKTGLQMPTEDIPDLSGQLKKEQIALTKARTLQTQKKTETLGVGSEEKEKKPSWSQSQKVQAIKSGLKRGRITIGRMMGEPMVYEIATREDALNAIADANLDPSLFEQELAQLPEAPQEEAPKSAIEKIGGFFKKKEEEKVLVIRSDGQIGYWPKSKLDIAKRNGYKLYIPPKPEGPLE